MDNMDSAGAKSVMSNDMKELREGKEEIGSTIRGHLANLSNPSKFSSSSLPLQSWTMGDQAPAEPTES